MAAKKKGRGASRRRAKDTKAETVETTTGAIQLKLPAPDKIKHHLANAEAWEKKLDDMKSHVKKAYETSTADGVSKSLLKDLMALKAGDPMVFKQKMQAYGIGLQAIGAPFQLNVFDTMYEDDVSQAKAEARIAARAGRGPECRFAEGSAAHQAFLEEYHQVQSSMVPGADKLTEGEIRGAVKEGAAEKKAAPKLEVVH